MSKSAVVIGVNKTGELPLLKDAAAGAKRVADWLASEGYQTLSLLDEITPGVRSPVRAYDIFTAVSAALAPGTCEQLVIYFSGHGYLNDGAEHWLLSDAPSNPNEAINLEENIQLARDCGVPNVIFISDACRSTPQSIKADRVRGTLIFPNAGVNANARADVDRFFACLPGDPAYEVTVEKSSKVYRALFTQCLENAYLDTPESLTTKVAGVEILSNRTLKRHLPGLVYALANKLSATIYQKPDAIVESEPDVYLGRVRRTEQVSAKDNQKSRLAGAIEAIVPFNRMLEGIFGSTARKMYSWPSDGDDRQRAGRSDFQTLRSHADDLMAEALGIAAYSGSPPTPNPALKGAIAIAAQIAGVDHFDAGCGFGVRGADILEVSGLGCVAEIVNPGRADEDRLVRVTRPDEAAVGTPFSGTVLLRFSGGDCAAIPAIEGYIATIVVDRDGGGDGPTDGIVQIAYTPAQNDFRFAEFQAKRTEVESLRSLVGALARNGVLHLGKELAPAFAERIRDLKAYDPSFGVYAGYAYNDAGLVEDIRSVMGFMLPNLMGSTIYDLALLLREARTNNFRRLFPCCPMMSQGWVLLRVLGGDLPAAIREASEHRRASLWTTFKPAGADIIFNATRNGDLK